MTSFDHRFLESITVARQSLGNGYKAYKMDSTSDGRNMRALAGLGTCHCCDYFLPKNDNVLLIEETQLMKTISMIRTTYNYLNSADQDKAVNKSIISEIQLKAYGAMLVLCRLNAKCPQAKKLIGSKKYHFWLVASSIESEEDKKYFDSLKDALRQTLNMTLGKKLLDDVDVLSSDTLKERLR